MNRTLALVLTAIVSAVVGGSSMWFVLRPSPPEDNGLEAPPPSEAQFRLTGDRWELDDADMRQKRRGGVAARNPSAEKADTAIFGTSQSDDSGRSESPQSIQEPSRFVRIQQPAIVHWSATVRAKSGEVSPAQQIDLEQLTKEGVMLDQVILPIPREAFAALGLSETKRWLRVSRVIQKVSTGSSAPADTALHLGATIADGFVAAEADDIQDLDMVVRKVEFLSRALGVEKIIERRSPLILSGAKARNWHRVRTELDGVLLETKEGVGEPVADLIKLGGWLRGTEALTAMISLNYSKDAAELLHQPSVLKHFIRRLDGLPRGERTELVADVYKALTEMRILMGSDAPTPSASDVTKINKITGALVERIALAPVTGQSISLR